MKTKPFLLATAGSTVDGRTIDDAMLEQMVSSYNPKTYGARLNIEHVRGMTGDGPFRAFGDVLELSLGTVEVDFNGKKEQRTALFGTFDVTEDARKLNQAGQKVYPSIEIEPNFAGKGFAYLMGCALTDSPASIATQRLQFNRSLPGTLTVAGEEAALLEFAETTEAEPAQASSPGCRACSIALPRSSRPPRPRPTLPRLPIPRPPPRSTLACCAPARRIHHRPARKWPESSPPCAPNSAPRPMRWRSSSSSSKPRRRTPRARVPHPQPFGRTGRQLCRGLLGPAPALPPARPASRHHRT
jgi:hypothetical protein